MRALSPKEYNPYYGTYVSLVEGTDFLKILKENREKTLRWLKQLKDEQWDIRYAEGKWSVKEVWIHMIDAERIFCYRALRIARGDKTPMSGFEQNEYIQPAKAEKRSAQSIIHEYQTVRDATLSMFENMDQEMLDQMGTASDSPISALALAHITVGHEIHHSNILRERYQV